MNQIAKVFELKANALNLTKGVELVVLMGLPLVVAGSLDLPQYWLTFSFAILFVALSEPGADHPYASRVRWFAGVAVVGALATALGFALGGGDWGPVVLIAFLATLLSGFAAAYGKHMAQVAYLLIIWFIITLALPRSYALVPWPAHPWPQALAWLAGGALWILLTFVVSLRNRGRQPSASDPPQQAASVSLSQPLILFSALRAIAVAIAVAIAWGFKLPHADWMPVAVLVVMKPGFDEALFFAEQRVAGAILGALLAAGLLTLVPGRDLLAVFIVACGALAGATRDVNYAIYCTFVATVVLTGMGLGHPGNLADNWERVAWTIVGVAIGLGTMLLAGLATRVRRPRAAQA
jgi:uncharacterized membrane protein YccC